jgi:hypothetical protein
MRSRGDRAKFDSFQSVVDTVVPSGAERINTVSQVPKT